MGGRGSKSQATYQILTSVQTQPSAQAAAQANDATFKSVDNSPYHDLYNGRQYFKNQNLTIDQQLAIQNYLSPTTESGSLYSMSQNMNYAMANGKKLTANQQYVHDNMMQSMHNLGYNSNLTRYDHAPMINNLLAANGANKDYSNYSEKQLKSLLVGTTYGENKFVSTSYNNFKNAPASSKQVFDSRAVKISYKAKAKTQVVMPGDGAGGALGEIVIAPSGNRKNYKVVDVKFTGQKARAKGTQSYSLPQVELVVEVD